jgi:cytochrome c biogenesis protein CcdA
MNSNRMLQQFHAIFGIFMVVFYLGISIFLFFFAKMFKIDQALRVIIGSTFILLGIYRITVTYKQIKESFFIYRDEEE